MSQKTEEYPTMIIPKGTEIKVNEKGQLSIKTPGNLVIQNSGNYSLIKSEKGSIKVEPMVNVEAVEVEAADTCLIQGNLTAWKVKAKKLCLEEKAQAFIMIQESEELELAKSSRLVGNFSSEREIYLLLGKFSPELKALPSSINLGKEEPQKALSTPKERENLSIAQVILEREFNLGIYDPDSLQALKEIINSIKLGEKSKIKQVFGFFSKQIKEPSEELKKAFSLLEEAL
ncbi:MAG: hypothetical protein WHV67_02160 [Thermoanaerobaculia bacterium]